MRGFVRCVLLYGSAWLDTNKEHETWKLLIELDF